MRILIGVFSVLMAFGFSVDIDKKSIARDLELVRETYSGLNSYSIDLEYSEYDAFVGGNLVSFNKGVMNRNGDMYSVILPQQKTVSRDGITVVKNDEERMVLISDYNAEEQSPFSELPVEDILDMASSCKPIDNLKKGYRGYRFDFQNAAYDQVDIIINLETKYIARIIVYGNSLDEDGNDVKGRLEIRYKMLTRNPVFDSKTFSVNDIVVKRNDGYQLTPTLKNYRLINNQTQP